MRRDSVYYNHSGYYDPTAGRAIKNTDKDQKDLVRAKGRKRNKTGVRWRGVWVSSEFLQQ